VRYCLKDFRKYQGIFPAFYACYDDAGNISPERVRAFTEYLSCHVIYRMCACKGNMYAVIKGILRAQGGPDIGGVRAPLYELQPEDLPAVEALAEEIDRLVKKYA